MSLVATLCNLTYTKLGLTASKRVDAITEIYKQMDELEDSER